MPLNIETFSNAVGGNAFYKAVTHPLAAGAAKDLVERLRAAGPVAIYDPHNLLAAFDALYPLERVEIAGLFVQDVSHIGRMFRGQAAKPVTEIGACKAGTVLVAAFDAKPILAHLSLLLPKAARVLTFDELRLPDDMLTDRQRYLSNLNFATNFAFFRDGDGHHTRLVTANYWGLYGNKGGSIWLQLFDAEGRALAEWRETLPEAGAAIVIDSAAIRARFDLPAFTGQLFLHVVGAAGHDIVKYALDTYGDAPEMISCTHDANSWPANLYAGLPAPRDDEDVVLWVQNAHPTPIAAGEIGLNLMGDDRVVHLDKALPAFASHPLHVKDVLPHARWPQQIEIRAGKHMVRPRYEVTRGSRLRIAHPNVEREDLKLDEKLPTLGALLGKGFILPAPVLPTDRYVSSMLPTPMSTVQARLPLKAAVYDRTGKLVAEHSFGALSRKDSVALTANELLNGKALEGGYGHMELTYDFDAGAEADGWLHALFRFEDTQTGHAAETSFGAHVFNTLVTYKGEPQSYKGPPPGLSTRLFLRVGVAPHDTICHLIYPASQPWHAESDTALLLMSGQGKEVAHRSLRIACGGSVLWRVNETFSATERAAAGDNAYVVVRDTTCRLFGYHGVLGDRAFSLDHMFGF